MAWHVALPSSPDMKIILLTLALPCLLLVDIAHAQVPPLLNYQGRVAVGTTNFNGTGQFKFALVNATGTTTFWSNDGTSSAGGEPAAAVALSVTKGLYSVQLGDTTLANMTVVPASVFTNADVRLRVWFDDGTNGSQLLSPDQRITSVGYAMVAGDVPDGSITSAKIAGGAVGSSQLASGLALNGTLTGNASTATSAVNFTGALAGDVTGMQGATVVGTVGGVTAENVAAGANLANAATNLNTASAIVKRDAGGNFEGGTITGATLSSTGAITLPATSSSSVGVITQNGGRFIHSHGSNNFFAGTSAGNFTMTGDSNVAVGGLTLFSNSTGSDNTASGFFALGFNTTGSQNTAIGSRVMLDNTTGSQNTAVGSSALRFNTEGSSNTASGVSALQGNTTGHSNTATGSFALSANTIGTRNTADGNLALFNNTTAGRNVALGNGALQAQSFSNSSTAWDSNNVAVGVSALAFNQPASTTTGVNNTAVGTNALRLNTTGASNIAIGNDAGSLLTTGSNNITIGHVGVAAESNTIRIGTSQTTTYIAGIITGNGSGLTGITGSNLAANSIGSSQLASGLTLAGTTTGTFSGNLTGNVTGNTTTATTAGSATSFTGPLAGDVTGTQGATAIAASTVTGKVLTGFSSAAGTVSASDTLLTAINKLDGNLAAKAPLASPTFTGTVTAASFVGDGSGLTGLTASATGTSTNFNIPSTTSSSVGVITQNGSRFIHSYGASNLFFGYNTGNFTTTGNNNTALGVNSLTANTSGSSNTAIGASALNFNLSGSQNTAAGSLALYDNATGVGNTASGYSALRSNVIGHNNTATGLNALQGNTSAGRNVAIGAGALQSQTFNNGYVVWNSNNVALGYQALNANQPTSTTTGINNTAVGTNALVANTTGANNIAIGYNAGNLLTSGSNNITIGHVGVAAESNTIRIGTSQTTTYIAGVITGDGSGLTGITGSNLAANSIGSSQLASGLTLAGTTTGTFSGNLTGNVTGNATTATTAGSATSFTGPLAGDVTGTQGATAIAASTVTGKALTGFSSAAGTVSASDTLLTAINKLDGNLAAKAPLASPTFTGTVTAASFVGDGSGLTGLTASATGTSTNFNIPSTTSSSVGVITQNGGRFIHSYGTSNFFAGAFAGNFSMTGTQNVGVGLGALAVNSSGADNTATGYGSLGSNTSGAQNTASGYLALYLNSTGTSNTASGHESLRYNSSGGFNTANGAAALQFNTTGFLNTASGAAALRNNTTGGSNTAVGHNSLAANTTGTNNIAIGKNAGVNLTTGDNNIAIGHSGVVAESNIIRIGTAGTHTTAFIAGVITGNGSGLTGITGSNLAANSIGSSQLASGLTLAGTTTGTFSGNLTGNVTGNATTATTAGSATSFTGPLAGDVTGTQGATAIAASTVTGKALTGFTSGAGTVSASDTLLTAINKLDGNLAAKAPLASPTFTGTVTAASFVGDGSGLTGITAPATSTSTNFNIPSTTSSSVGVITQNGGRFIHSYGTSNFFAGASAGNFSMTGNSNTAVGQNVFQNNTTGSENIAIGIATLINNTTGNYNTANGSFSMVSNTTGSANTANGYFALYNNSIAIHNTANGAFALRYNTTAGRNVAIGSYALRAQSFNNSDTTWYSNNVAVGYQALDQNQPTSTTTGINNTALGTNALIANTTGANNIAIGYNAGNLLTSGSNNITIGHSGLTGESNTIRIGTTGTQTRAFVSGIRGITTGSNDAVTVVIDSSGQLGTISSSRRYKEDIADMGEASARLQKLRPVTFRYKTPYTDGRKPVQFGLIAEEVAETFPELTVYNEDGQPETVKYQDLTPMLLNEVQKQQRHADSRDAELEALKKDNAELRARLDKLEAALEKLVN
jgi:hypothetical protein